MEVRKCTKCGEVKSLEEFQIVNSVKGWRRHSCNVCESQRKQDYYNTNHDEVRAKQNKKARAKYSKLSPAELAEKAAWQRLYLEKHRVAVIAGYGSKCACCGEDEPKFLTIDHVNNDGYLARKNKLHPTDTLGFYRWLLKHNLPKEFQLLCMNCNFGKARNNGVCPHHEGSTTIPKGSTAKRPEVRGTLSLVKAG
jgi:hypothetical protein